MLYIIGINMTINSNSINSPSVPSSGGTQPSLANQQSISSGVNFLTAANISDLRPPSRSGASSSSSCGIGGGGGGGSTGNGGAGGSSSIGGIATSCSSTSVLASNISEIPSQNLSSEPVAGPSGLGPVQSVPLVCSSFFTYILINIFFIRRVEFPVQRKLSCRM